MHGPATTWRVETRTKTSTIFMAFGALAVIAGLLAPLYVPRAALQDLFFILTMLVLAQSWNLLAGYAGLVSVGQQAFVGLGAYVMFAGVLLFKLDPLVAILLGGFAAALLAIPAGIFAFRLQGAYFAIGTWVVAEIVRLVVAQWKTLGGGTGTSLPGPATRSMLGIDLAKNLFGFRPAQAVDVICYWVALLLAVATILLVYRLLRSRQGLALASVRDNHEAARAIGVDARRLRAIVYVASAFMTGIVGALIYVQKARISPDAAFSLTDWTAYVIFIVVIGGIGTIEGPIVGVLIFFGLQKLLADFGSIYLLVLGLIGIVVMLFAQEGLWGLFASRTGIQLLPVRRLLRGGSLKN
ncbi:ABC transporter permease [Bradyrhizobium macuxiense]|uniref:ABC transporter permease n=1 Tax=Bradyrhizobium macuxiense TaxID=1755647 RepID=A0A125Q6M8_9BRAD|nr:branched-chain amino acid ABC transporter permease [Bradyrhizobium macuxiense]KWV48425.1 ABC transporter permease [Bradyrhizobium macuxiense]